MDPNETLKQLRRLVEKQYALERSEGMLDSHDVARLVTLVDAMDNWIRHGGFLPRAWREGQDGFTPRERD
jgi:hypothetical protein